MNIIKQWPVSVETGALLLHARLRMVFRSDHDKTLIDADNVEALN